jgi:SRSO17 transposase
VRPLVFQFARVRVWAVRHRKAGAPIWVMFQRSVESPEVIKYHVSNAGPEVTLETLALVASKRWPVEELFEDGKGSLGMADYEARAWTSWHHHMSLVALAHLFVTLTRKDLKRGTPELTLDMAVRILKAVLPRPELSEEDALEILD